MEPTCKMEIESTDAENNFMVTKGGLGGGINQETQYYLQNTHYYIKKKKKKITNKDPLHSTGNPTQYYAKLLQSYPILCNPVDYIAHQAPLSIEFSRQEYWSGLPFPSPGDLPDPGIESTSLMSPALADGFFTTSATWEVLSAM